MIWVSCADQSASKMDLGTHFAIHGAHVHGRDLNIVVVANNLEQHGIAEAINTHSSAPTLV